MEIFANKVLVLKTKDPQKFSIIPKSQDLGRDKFGMHEIAVHWGLDEARVLKNMGFLNTPSPIQKEYAWPGKYKPMQHQIDTASFLTMNRKAFVLSEAGCVDSDTEYLSPTGWRRISEYTSGEVAQYHAGTGHIEFVHPTDYIKKPCAAMLHIKTKYGIDQMLSPEHRMILLSDANPKLFDVLTAQEVYEAHNDFHAKIKRSRRLIGGIPGFGHMAIPAAFQWGGSIGVALSDAELRVQVAVIADGHFSKSNTNWCTVRLKKDRKVARMHSILKAAGIEYLVRKQNTATAKGFHIFRFNAPIKTKEFGSYFWGVSATQLEVLRSEVFMWDGCVRAGAKGSQFFSTNKNSADFVQFMFSSIGKIARITIDSHRKTPCYIVTVRASEQIALALKNKTKPTVFEKPSTDGFKYCFTVPTSFLVFRRNGCVFASGNTGKTVATLWAADYLMDKGEVRRVLVICPLSIMRSAWMGDITKSIIHRSAVVAYHTDGSKRVELVRKNYEIVITNYDGLNIIKDEIIRDGTFDLIIADEASHYQNTATTRWKNLNMIMKAHPSTMLWMMTGTPAAQSPEQAYGLAKLINPNAIPKYVSAWRDMVMNKISMYKWVPKPGANQRVFDALQPAIRHTKAECLDLPPVLTETRDVEMTPQQKKYYKLLKDNMLVSAAGETITAVNAAAGVNKLLQISSGGAYTDTHETLQFDCKPRLNVLMEVIEETSRKILIFVPYRHSISFIEEFLIKEKIGCALIHGDVSVTKRTEIFKRFQEEQDLKVLIIQPQAASHGVTLTAADTVVFWGPVMSLETYIQCIARADRFGQSSDKVTVVLLQSSDIERRMFRRLADREELHDGLVKLYEEELHDD